MASSYFNVSQNITDFKYIDVEYTVLATSDILKWSRHKVSDLNISSSQEVNSGSVSIAGMANSTTVYMRALRFTEPQRGIWSSAVTSAGSVNNSYCIPYQIFGVN